VEAQYPQLAKATSTQGMIAPGCLIADHWNVTQLRPVSRHPRLMQVAVAAVRSWKYQPTWLNGVPVAVEMKVMVNFILEN